MNKSLVTTAVTYGTEFMHSLTCHSYGLDYYDIVKEQ